MKTELSTNVDIHRRLYSSLVKRKLLLIYLTLIILTGLLLTDIITGPAWLPVKEVFSAIFFPRTSDRQAYVIVWIMRLPTAVTALVVGASLGIAGAEMQLILDNPMASPYTLGISSAASFGAALAIVTGKGIMPSIASSLPIYTIVVPFNAFLFALLSSLFIYFIARAKSGNVETIILTGIIMVFLFNAMVSILQYVATEDALQGIIRWSYGDLTASKWSTTGIILIILLVSLPLLVFDSWKLTALRLGDGKAKSMGVNVEKLRLKVLIVISINTAAAVCFVGTIGFVGLVAPHISRWLMGEDHRFFMPFSALLGAAILSSASILSKLIIPGAIIPVGIITSIIGVPFLLSIVLNRRKGRT